MGAVTAVPLWSIDGFGVCFGKAYISCRYCCCWILSITVELSVVIHVRRRWRELGDWSRNAVWGRKGCRVPCSPFVLGNAIQPFRPWEGGCSGGGAEGSDSTDNRLLPSRVQDPLSLLSTWGPELETQPCLTLRKSEESHTTPYTLFQHYWKDKCLWTACNFRTRHQINQMFAQTIKISELSLQKQAFQWLLSK